jgi:ribosomal protein L16 Arg81 hydroxylase
MTEEMLGKDGHALSPDLLGPPIIETVLEAGDTLYMPRGYAHEAMTGGDDPSLHLTVTMPTSDFTWAGVLKRDVRHHHRQSTDCRQVIPLGDLSKVASDPAAKAQYEALLGATLKDCGFQSARMLFQGQVRE